MKKKFFGFTGFLALIALTFLVSCNDDSPLVIENSKEFNESIIKKGTSEYFEVNGEKFYSEGDTLVAYQPKDTVFGYIGVSKDNSYYTVEDDFTKTGYIKFVNKTTSENFFLKNVQYNEKEYYFTFDLATSNGVRIYGLRYNTTNSAFAKGGGGSWGVIIAIAEFVVDHLPSGGGEGDVSGSCAKAFGALRCPQGYTPYMSYSGGGWFSNASCEVGCKPYKRR